MAYQSLDLGTSADDGTGDSLRVGGDKINDNFSEIYTLLGTGTALTSGLSANATVVTLTSAVGTFTTLTPAAADGTALGSATLEWSDLFLADGAVINLGADQDVTLTHVADTGILLNSTRQLQFGDSGTYIHQSADGVLDLVSDTELELNATTIDINGAVEISGTLAQVGVLTTTATQVATGGITSGSNIVSDTDSTDDLGTTGVRWANLFVDAITATDQITATGFTGTLDGILGSGTAAAATTTTLASTTITASGIIKTDDTTEATSTTDGSLQTDGGLSVAKDVVAGDDVKLLSDAAVLAFGADGDVTLTHVADTGILLNSTMAIQFNDASQSINAPSNAILDINATDEIELNATLVDVNANLDVSGSLTIAGSFTPASITSSGILKTDDTTEATSTTDGALQSDGGLSVAKDVVAGNDVKLLSDASILSFGADGDVTLTHVADTGILLNSTRQLQFNDASQFIKGSSNAILDLGATDKIGLTATLIEVTGNQTISGTATTTGVHTFTAVPVFPNNTIETADIQADAVTGAKIADDAINSEHYAADSIDAEHYAAGSVDTTAIAADAVTGAKIADDAINSEHYTNGSIDTAHIAADQIVASLIADNAIDSEHYTDGSIDTAHYAAGSINDTALGADCVTSAKIGDDQINSEHYVAGSIDAEHLTAGMVLQVVNVELASTTQLTSAGSISELSTSLRLAITPKNASSTLYLEVFAPFTSPGSINIAYAYFYDVTNTATVNLPSANGDRQAVTWSQRTSAADANDADTMYMTTKVAASNTNARTYTIYHGTEGATHQFLNTTLSTSAGQNTKIHFRITEVR